MMSDSDRIDRAQIGNYRVYGKASYHNIQQAKVLLIGLGGVGSWAAEALARSGVGSLTLMDMDVVSQGNINRQLCADLQAVGKNKIDVMADRIASINPACEVILQDAFLQIQDCKDDFAKTYDVVLDCIDQGPVKAALIAHCLRQKIPVVTTGGAGGKIDPSKICCGDLEQSIQDPLLAKLKQRLKQTYQVSMKSANRFGVPAVWSTESMQFCDDDGQLSQQKPVADRVASALSCDAGLGSAVVVTASFGFQAAALALNEICKELKPF